MADSPDEALPTEDLDRPFGRGRGAASQILMAAMLGLSDAFGWERPPTDIVQVAPDLTTGDLPLSFGDLPPFD